MQSKPTFDWPIRVYYEDTDAGGIVYHANYLKYFERARTEFLRKSNLSQSRLLGDNIGFVVKTMEIDFLKAATLDQELVVKTSISKVQRASMMFEQVLIDTDQTLLCRAFVKIACVNTDKMKPQSIPISIQSEILSER